MHFKVNFGDCDAKKELYSVSFARGFFAAKGQEGQNRKVPMGIVNFATAKKYQGEASIFWKASKIFRAGGGAIALFAPSYPTPLDGIM